MNILFEIKGFYHKTWFIYLLFTYWEIAYFNDLKLIAYVYI